MSQKPEKTGFSADKTSRAFSVIALSITALTVVSAELNHVISGRQDGFLDVLLVKFAKLCTAKTLEEDMAAVIAVGRNEIQLLIYLSVGIYAAIIGLLGYATLFLFFPAIAHIRKQRKQLEHMTSSDLLTGLYNRAALFKVASMLINGAKRHKYEVSVLAIDIDELKKINDAKGRAAGDAALREVASALGETLRNSDAIGRVGGNEFAIFLPSTNEYQAMLVAEKLRKAVEDVVFGDGYRTLLLRISIGVAEMQQTHKTPDDILRAAEAALRQAKKTGRNKVVPYSALLDAPVAETPKE